MHEGHFESKRQTYYTPTPTPLLLKRTLHLATFQHPTTLGTTTTLLVLFVFSTMQASAGLVAGSHNRNELVVIHGHEEVQTLFVCKVRNGQEICDQALYIHEIYPSCK